MGTENVEAHVDELDEEAVCRDNSSLFITDIGRGHRCLDRFVQNRLESYLQNRDAVKLEAFDGEHENSDQV